MRILKLNIAANLAGRMYSAIIAIVAVPVYVRYLGPEAYGLVGILTSLFAIFSVLDLGLSSALTRHLASTAFRSDQTDEVRSTVRSLEIIYWSVALVLCAVVAGASGLLAAHWFRAQGLSIELVQNAVKLMGLVILFQWPAALYSGGLQGLQRQVLFNGITIAGTTLRVAGAVCLLVWISKSILLFFLWQAFSTLLTTVALWMSLWWSLPSNSRTPRFRWMDVSKVSHFAMGMTAITFLAIVLTQMDKVILSRALPLTNFGYYVIAGTVAASVSYLFQPVYLALFPKFSELVAQGNHAELVRLYHRSCGWVSLLVLPVTAVLAVNSYTVLMVWTRDGEIAENAWAAMALLVLGTALNGLMNLPYALQLAHGWTRLPILMGMGTLTVFAPLMIVLTRRFGMNGAASVWLLLNLSYVLIDIPLMHRRLLVGEVYRWYVRDVGRPLVISMSVAWLMRIVTPMPGSRLLQAVALTISFALTTGAVLMAMPDDRKGLTKWLKAISFGERPVEDPAQVEKV